MSIKLNKDGSIEITKEQRIASCRWCRIASYDSKTFNGHAKTAKHIENKQKNPNAIQLTAEECEEIIKNTNKKCD